MNNLNAAATALLQQIDIGDFTDSLGHSAKMLKAVADLREALSPPAPVAQAVVREVSVPDMLMAVAKWAGWGYDAFEQVVLTDHSEWVHWHDVQCIWRAAQDAAPRPEASAAQPAPAQVVSEASHDVAKMVNAIRHAASALGDMRMMAARNRANSDDVSEAQQAFDIELNALAAAAEAAQAAGGTRQCSKDQPRDTIDEKEEREQFEREFPSRLGITPSTDDYDDPRTLGQWEGWLAAKAATQARAAASDPLSVSRREVKQ